MLELQGFYMESRQGYQEALTKAEVGGLPQYHIRVRMKTVLPRILPSSESGDIPIFSFLFILSYLTDTRHIVAHLASCFDSVLALSTSCFVTVPFFLFLSPPPPLPCLSSHLRTLGSS